MQLLSSLSRWYVPRAAKQATRLSCHGCHGSEAPQDSEGDNPGIGNHRGGEPRTEGSEVEMDQSEIVEPWRRLPFWALPKHRVPKRPQRHGESHLEDMGF